MAILGTAASLAGCSGPTDLSVGGGVGVTSQAVIADQDHGGGAKGFQWLPPIVTAKMVGPLGGLIAGVPCTVRIDELDGKGGVLKTLATFTANSGPENEHIRFYPDPKGCHHDDHDWDADDVGYYLARWDTDDFHLSPAANYRVRVLVPASGGGTRELGFTDVAVVKNRKEAQAVDTTKYTPLIKGQDLDIKCRIDAPAVDADGDGVFDWRDNCPTVKNADQKDSLKNGVGDACRCLHVACAPMDACHLAGVCQPATGKCSSGAAPDGTACAIVNAQGICQGGACHLAGCKAGFGDCDNQPANGCETPVDTLGNCGACGVMCAGGPNSTAVCANGACGLACAPGYADCDGNPGTGCEQNVATDPANCGACGKACAKGQLCMGGACSGVVCQAGTADCNQNAADGCEVTLGTDVKNCGACNVACAFAHAAAQCNGGACVLGACDAGQADCDHAAVNGCEVSTGTDIANCGACGNACVLPNAVPACAAGTCAIAACNPGFADCDHLLANGCEVNLLLDPNNCGSCGGACAVPNATASCGGGSCGIAACSAGYFDCNNKAADGCEIQIAADPSNCGQCGNACPSGANSAAVCGGGACAIACTPGFLDCDGKPESGCEIAAQSDLHNCGGCGVQCVNHSTCQKGACSTAVCQAGFADCDKNANDGCEVALGSDAANCGGCGMACQFANAIATCTNSTCGFSVCQDGFADCDGLLGNGCEVDLTADPANCGGCGAACAEPNATPLVHRRQVRSS